MVNFSTYTKDYLDAHLLVMTPLILTPISGYSNKVTVTGLEETSTKVYNIIIGSININNTVYPICGGWDIGNLETDPIIIGNGITLEQSGTDYILTTNNGTDIIDITKTRLITMAQ